MPKEGFTYGKPNRPPTPIKDIINNNYGNLAEISIRDEYRNFIRKIRSHSNLNINNKLNNMRKTMEAKMKKIEEQKNKNELNDKPGGNISAKNKIEHYKLKMFMDVKSKVAESIKMFKSYRPMKKKIKEKAKINNLSSIDNMINKLEDEAKQKELKLSETLPAIN